MTAGHIREGGLDDPRVVALLETHVRTARAQTAAGSAHALDLAALRAPSIRLWSYWDAADVLGVGALKRLAGSHAELKSMHTAQAARGLGVASALLRHIIETARAEGLTRLSLENGSWDYFAAARAFYRRRGFVDCAPFEGYAADPNSAFLSMAL
ncbi:MAG: GNAT family N-acetyltransferase [Rudaea sp.]